MEIALLIIGIIIIVMLAVVLFTNTGGGRSDRRLTKAVEDLSRQSESVRRENREMMSELRQELSASTNESIRALGEQLRAGQTSSSEQQKERLELMGKAQTERIGEISRSTEKRLAGMDKSLNDRLIQLETRFGTLETSIESRLQRIREDNNTQLEKIRGTVDEKLQKTLESKMNESFRLVSERLEQVYKGLGEMQAVAQDVGDLKKVLSNVKSRGILGELQLEAILQEILTPDQYEREIPTVPGSANRVEFAIRLPGAEEGSIVYLPIDSKFNGDAFMNLQDAIESGDRALIQSRKKELTDAVKKCAKDIRDKYISPPHTTSFAIMFLPVESLYAEVVSTPGLVEELQRTYHINAAGPSTMAAMLNSLRMGFRTLAIQKRSSEVWSILGAVKTEFGRFEEALTDTQKRLRRTEESLEQLVGVRTRRINRQLNRIEALPDDKLTLTETSDKPASQP